MKERTTTKAAATNWTIRAFGLNNHIFLAKKNITIANGIQTKTEKIIETPEKISLELEPAFQKLIANHMYPNTRR